MPVPRRRSTGLDGWVDVILTDKERVCKAVALKHECVEEPPGELTKNADSL